MSNGRERLNLTELTRGNAIVKDAETVMSRMKAIGQESFNRSAISDILEPFTSRVEYYLKSTVFPTVSRRTTLNDLINNLSSVGLAANDVAALHRLRLLYNDSKHDPDKALAWRDCIEAISGTVVALKSISEMRIPTVDAAFENEISTVVYVGFWDHYVGGETEVGLFLPSDHWLGTAHISTFHLSISAWDVVKPVLAGHPRFTFGENALGSELWASFSSEGDFLNAGIWQGDVRELLNLLSDFNDENLEVAVLPGLARRNDQLSIGIALVSAAVDIARGESALSGSALRQRISERAKEEYAAHLETPHAQAILDSVVTLIESVSVKQRVSISGPAFRRSATETQTPVGTPLLMDRNTFVWLIR